MRAERERAGDRKEMIGVSTAASMLAIGNAKIPSRAYKPVYSPAIIKRHTAALPSALDITVVLMTAVSNC